MAFLCGMFFYSIFRKITNEFIYVMMLTYIFEYVIFGTIHILLNAKPKEYEVDSDAFKVKNLIAIPAISVLMVIFIKFPQFSSKYSSNSQRTMKTTSLKELSQSFK